MDVSATDEDRVTDVGFVVVEVVVTAPVAPAPDVEPVPVAVLPPAPTDELPPGALEAGAGSVSVPPAAVVVLVLGLGVDIETTELACKKTLVIEEPNNKGTYDVGGLRYSRSYFTHRGC
jgi:hypothetical protein